jgi:hypothetical protein
MGKNKTVIIRAFTKMNMRESLTHKRLAFHNYKKKIPTSENARLIDHIPEYSRSIHQRWSMYEKSLYSWIQ